MNNEELGNAVVNLRVENSKEPSVKTITREELELARNALGEGPTKENYNPADHGGLTWEEYMAAKRELEEGLEEEVNKEERKREQNKKEETKTSENNDELQMQ